MTNNANEIEKLAKSLATYAKLKLDYSRYLSKSRKLLIVEGPTDFSFIEKIRDDFVDCVIASIVYSSTAHFRTNPSEYINCKNAIVSLITGITHFPSPFLSYPEGLDKWDIYGLVDSDCEELVTCRPTPRLFVTDTHDLETLILSTDGKLLCRLKECSISLEDAKKAYFIAYQLAFFRSQLKENQRELNLRVISCSSSDVDFSEFVKDGSVCLLDLVNHLNLRSGSPLSSAEVNKICNRIIKGKVGRKTLYSNGNWKQDYDNFDIASIMDFWNSVNGHDILQLLLFINESAYDAFHDSRGYKLNRTFEMSLIASYDYSRFGNTSLHGKMYDAKLLRA